MVWVYLRASKPHIPNRHHLYRVAEIVAMATCGTVSNAVGMIGTKAGQSVQIATMVV
jgi:hypothetical protein